MQQQAEMTPGVFFHLIQAQHTDRKQNFPQQLLLERVIHSGRDVFMQPVQTVIQDTAVVGDTLGQKPGLVAVVLNLKQGSSKFFNNNVLFSIAVAIAVFLSVTVFAVLAIAIVGTSFPLVHVNAVDHYAGVG